MVNLTRLFGSVIALFALATIVSPSLFAQSEAPPPNILLILTDDQGYRDVGSYGAEFPTPNIDRLAREGLRFTQFYAASSICTPSRFGLLTGMNPSRSQDRLLGALMFMADEDKSRGIRDHETTIAEVLRDEAGYDTALIGKWHLGHGDRDFLPPSHGFDLFIGHTGGCIDFFTMTYGVIPDWYHNEEIVSENGYATELITEEANHYLARRAEDPEKPFFLFLAYNAPHFGKGYSPADGKPVNLMQPQASDLKRVETISDKIRREFAAMTTSLDDGVGRVLKALDENGQSERTLVIFLTDHGGDPTYGGANEPFRGKKATLFEGGIRVPAMFRWPGKIKAGSSNDDPAWAIDLFPTFCELAGIDLNFVQPHDGISLASVLEGAAFETNREFLWETGSHAELGRERWLALRKGDLKYVRSPEEGEFLFDIASDPEEKANLKESRNSEFKRLRSRA
ncbi:MAG: sulfatase-like hydrolase/transferase, partial [Verrucomicrobiota bacterium]